MYAEARVRAKTHTPATIWEDDAIHKIVFLSGERVEVQFVHVLDPVLWLYDTCAPLMRFSNDVKIIFFCIHQQGACVYFVMSSSISSSVRPFVSTTVTYMEDNATTPITEKK